MVGNFFDPLWRSQVIVPVKRIGGRWEFFYGGDVHVKEGTLGELRFAVDAIDNAAFLEQVTSEVSFRVLEEGTALLVALSDPMRSTPYSDQFPVDSFPQGIPHGTMRWEKVWLGPLKPTF